MNIIIYTNETCSYCKSIKEELEENNIEFEERITKDWREEYQDIVNLTGMPSVPTICYNKEYYVPGRDFQNPNQLITILDIYKKQYSEKDNNRRILEKVKTLNYNINIAFGKLDQLLRKIETKINTDEHKSTD